MSLFQAPAEKFQFSDCKDRKINIKEKQDKPVDSCFLSVYSVDKLFTASTESYHRIIIFVHKRMKRKEGKLLYEENKA